MHFWVEEWIVHGGATLSCWNSALLLTKSMVRVYEVFVLLFIWLLAHILAKQLTCIGRADNHGSF